MQEQPADSPVWTIRAVRQRLGQRLGRRVTLREFGQLVGEKEGHAPWPHPTVSRWETGRQLPGPGTRAAIAELGGIRAQDLVGSAHDIPLERQLEILMNQLRLLAFRDVGEATPRQSREQHVGAPEGASAATVTAAPQEAPLSAVLASPILTKELYGFLAQLAAMEVPETGIAAAKEWLTSPAAVTLVKSVPRTRDWEKKMLRLWQVLTEELQTGDPPTGG